MKIAGAVEPRPIVETVTSTTSVSSSAARRPASSTSTALAAPCRRSFTDSSALRAWSRSAARAACASRAAGCRRRWRTRGAPAARRALPGARAQTFRLEPVSDSSRTSLCQSRQFLQEKVWRGQRPGPDFCRRWTISRDRDGVLSLFPRQSPGKLKTFPVAPGNRICTGLRGGRSRIRTCDPLIKSLPEQADTARRSRTSRHRESLELAGVIYIC
jgi:hypothetical protein